MFVIPKFLTHFSVAIIQEHLDIPLYLRGTKICSVFKLTLTIGFSVCCEDGRARRIQSLNKNNSPAVRRITATTFSELPANILSGVTSLSLAYLQR
jgi:hypothetical protein